MQVTILKSGTYTLTFAQSTLGQVPMPIDYPKFTGYLNAKQIRRLDKSNYGSYITMLECNIIAYNNYMRYYRIDGGETEHRRAVFQLKYARSCGR